MLGWNLIGKAINIETVFLHGDLILMEIPKGMEANKNEFLILKRRIYGLFQFAREFYNKLVLSLEGCDFKGILFIHVCGYNIQSLELSWLQYILMTLLLLEAEKESRV